MHHVHLATEEGIDLDRAAFVALMETVARGWNEGDARLAAGCSDLSWEAFVGPSRFD